MFRRIALTAAAAVALAAPLATSGHAGAALTIPNIVPRVNCAVHSGKFTSYWFGYSNDGPAAWDINVGLGNQLLLNGALANRGQTTQFLTGTHNAAFVVSSVAPGATLAWTVTAATTRTAVTSASVPTCPVGYGARSATPQSVGAEQVNYRVASTSNSAGTLLSTSWSFSAGGVTSACSTGGTPLTPKYVYGYNDDALNFGAQWMTAGYAKNVNPLVGGGILGTVTDSAGRVFTRTSQSYRTVTNVQLVQTNTGVLSGTVTNRGLAYSTVIIDAFARCQFGTTIVTSRDPIWVDRGAGLKFNTVTTTGTSGADVVQAYGPFAKDGGSGGGGSYHR
jgi:hypothetical protein